MLAPKVVVVSTLKLGLWGKVLLKPTKNFAVINKKHPSWGERLGMTLAHTSDDTNKDITFNGG